MDIKHIFFLSSIAAALFPFLSIIIYFAVNLIKKKLSIIPVKIYAVFLSVGLAISIFSITDLLLGQPSDFGITSLFFLFLSVSTILGATLGLLLVAFCKKVKSK